MNDFVLYHNLCNLYAQAEHYGADREPVRELKQATQDYSASTYRVAVIGEFKRGKSSLVNALVGAEVLPTDILPTTAVVNRIVFSADQKIVIYFKDGQVRESAIDSLADYATKLDAEKEKLAETIREIVVHYPFVLGQTPIELIDTPGLNDNESMTETTLNILGQIDTAIVVISATMPLSMTEQNLICDLIRQADIYNLVFALSFIDRVSDEEDEQDRVVELIKNRLSGDTLSHFCQRYDDPYLVEKAKRILTQPNVYAVSAKQAIQGFIKGRNDLIEKSRFKQFKYNLSALLTANQKKDQQLKVQRICMELEKQVPQWGAQQLAQMEQQLQALQEQCAQKQDLHGASLGYLNKLLLQMEEDAYREKDRIFGQLGAGEEREKYLTRLFIAQLSSIRRSQFCTPVVIAALQRACVEANAFMEKAATEMTQTIDQLAREVWEQLEQHYRDQVELQPQLAKPEQKLVPVQLFGEEIFDRMDDLDDECMPYVTEAISAMLAAFDTDMEDYMAACRVPLIHYHKSVKSILEQAMGDGAARIEDMENQLQAEKAAEELRQRQIADTISIIRQS